MKAHRKVSTFFLVSGMLAAFMAAGAHAAPFKFGADAKRPQRLRAPYSTTVEYSGVIGGVMEINRVRYRIARDATVYVVGRGGVSAGIEVDHASLYLTGDRVSGGMLVRNVLIRPAAPSSRSGRTGTVPAGAPR
jgi:hypothetical protein